jgi:dihydrodipicolinate synthase/N-acetylneuraminate lyase
MFTSLHIRLSRLRLERRTPEALLPMPRIRHLGIRLLDDELARVVVSATAAGRSPAAWLRELALGSTAAAASPASFSNSVSASSSSAPLTRTVSTRLTAAQYEELEEWAAACGLPVAAYVRRAVLGMPVSPARLRRREVRPAIAALNQVGNNLNQLTKLAHGGMVFPAEVALAVGQVLAEVQRVRDAVLAVDE